MLLVIDVTKGIQTQTAECLIIGEITCDRMLVVLNKIDLIDESQRTTTIEKVKDEFFVRLFNEQKSSFFR